MNFDEKKKKKIEEIEEILQNKTPQIADYQSIIAEAMQYNLMAGGKRIRPMLMFETYQLFGGQSEIIHPFMAAIEMIHTYSLVHDDLPAMDDDAYRRGRETTHIKYGEAMGILTGDALLGYAFELIGNTFEQFPEQSLMIGRAMKILANKSGIYGMLGGQVVDVQNTGDSISKDKLLFIFRLKTSALIEASMVIGAVLAGAEERSIKIIEKIAQNIGIAFQIKDDILDVTSTREILGKETLSDEKNQKTTYVTLEGLENAELEVERLSKESTKLLEEIGFENKYLEQLILKLITREN